MQQYFSYLKHKLNFLCEHKREGRIYKRRQDEHKKIDRKEKCGMRGYGSELWYEVSTFQWEISIASVFSQRRQSEKWIFYCRLPSVCGFTSLVKCVKEVTILKNFGEWNSSVIRREMTRKIKLFFLYILWREGKKDFGIHDFFDRFL